MERFGSEKYPDRWFYTTALDFEKANGFQV